MLRMAKSSCPASISGWLFLGGNPLFLQGGVLHTIKLPEVFGKKQHRGNIWTCAIWTG
jgi:hypothetical protein